MDAIFYIIPVRHQVSSIIISHHEQLCGVERWVQNPEQDASFICSSKEQVRTKQNVYKIKLNCKDIVRVQQNGYITDKDRYVKSGLKWISMDRQASSQNNSLW